MVLPKSKNAVGLGNSLMNDRFGKGKGQDMRRAPGGIQRTGPDGQKYVTNEKEEAAWTKMRSVTEQNDLDEFLSTAELAGTDFTAEKLNNVKIIHKDQRNPYLLTADEERRTVKKQNANKRRLKVPRRPPWDENTTPQDLDAREKESLMEWRRGLADLQETNDLLMTPFERNLEVWRQLWRVIERSDLVVQIVDARNPLLFRCEDLESYVKEVDPKKNNLLLVNKADMMTIGQRRVWADYFKSANINFRFFSAELARDLNGVTDPENDDLDDHLQIPLEEEGKEEEEPQVYDETKLADEAARIQLQEEQEDEEEWTSEEELDEESPIHEDPEESTRILTTDELETLFLANAPEVDHTQDFQPRKTQIGLVGYPNVGKSSTINALIGAKKVSVSATPGKTKHFQTIHLSDSVILCDCPGLVFPNFATTKAELVCNGVLPIDQMREYTGPAALVAQRIPKSFLEGVYGIKIPTRPFEEGGTGVPTGEEVLRAYATARGFATTGQGQPDESRAARYVLKDYVKGKLLFCHPPPTTPPIDDYEFNRELYDLKRLPQKQQIIEAAQEASAAIDTPYASAMDEMIPPQPIPGQRSQALDKKFFGPGRGNGGHLSNPFHHRYSEQGTATGKHLSGRKLKTMIALERDVDPADLKIANGKKHYKGNKKKKQPKEEYT